MRSPIGTRTLLTPYGTRMPGCPIPPTGCMRSATQGCWRACGWNWTGCCISWSSCPARRVQRSGRTSPLALASGWPNSIRKCCAAVVAGARSTLCGGGSGYTPLARRWSDRQRRQRKAALPAKAQYMIALAGSASWPGGVPGWRLGAQRRQFLKLLLVEAYFSGGDDLFQVLRIGRAWNGQHGARPLEQPGQRDLR